jgi:hypothetical protein
MPYGGDPPNVNMPTTVFNTLCTYTYNATNKAFVDGSGNTIFLFVEKTTSGTGSQWFYGTEAQGGKNPKGLVPTLTSNIILSGSINTSTGVMTYSGTTYKIRLERDASGVPIANAYVV